MDGDPQSPTLRRSKRARTLPQKLIGTTAHPCDDGFSSEQIRSSYSSASREITRSSTHSETPTLRRKKSTTEPLNDTQEMPRVIKMRKGLDNEQESHSNSFITNDVNEDASMETTTRDKSGRKKSGTEQNTTPNKKTNNGQESHSNSFTTENVDEDALMETGMRHKSGRKKSGTGPNTTPKKKMKKHKDMDNEQPFEVPEDLKYISNVIKFYDLTIAAHDKSSEPQRPDNTRIRPTYGTTIKRATGRLQEWTADLGEFENFDNDFETSEDEPAEPTPSSQRTPTVFLVDLKPDLAEAIYKKFTQHCRICFGDKWLVWLDKLLWMNARDFRWVENMKRIHAGLQPYKILSKEEAKWYPDRNFRVDELMRSSFPTNEDYEWTLVESTQEEEVSYEDLAMAKKYAEQRGIPWEKVLKFDED